MAQLAAAIVSHDEEFKRQYTEDELPRQALQHSQVIWSLQKGDVHLEIRKVIK